MTGVTKTAMSGVSQTTIIDRPKQSGGKSYVKKTENLVASPGRCVDDEPDGRVIFSPRSFDKGEASYRDKSVLEPAIT
jgi:hypothetical protein